MKKPEFIEAATQAALLASRTSGLPPGITVAQAALESAWGGSRLSRDANNYFGIKAHGLHPWIELPTTEIHNGAAVRTRARFARYGSMHECFADRDLLILKNSRYQDARKGADRPEEFLRSLAASWATDPHYADKVLRVYHTNRLSVLDESFSATKQSPSSGSTPAGLPGKSA
jgi:flagellum-specific peptidoglycan hydrolase FlgJ